MYLIGVLNEKRSKYFSKACQDYNENLKIVDIDDYSNFKLNNQCVKIDPIANYEGKYSNYDLMLKRQMEVLSYFSMLDNNYLNDPKVLQILLDKKKTKEILIKNNLSVTSEIKCVSDNAQDLISELFFKKQHRVIIKPNFGSGAFGVCCLSMNPRNNEMVLITSFVIHDNDLINTKKINKYKDDSKIIYILDKVMNHDFIVEYWYPKAKYDNKNYDLRVVCNKEKFLKIVARLSNSPITNLHLNNNAIDLVKLNLSVNLLDKIEEISLQAINSFAGVNVVGIDLLITPKEEIHIIEMNGQGDCIYQDIYDMNLIYKNEVEILRRSNIEKKM